MKMDDIALVRQTSTNKDRQQNELLVLESIYGERQFVASPQGDGGRLFAHAELPDNFRVIYPSECSNVSASLPRSEDGPSCEEMQVEFLPPIILEFTLPENYPSEAAPSFEVKCVWLDSSQNSNLVNKLDAIWLEEGPGVEILYSWMQYLVEHGLAFAGVSHHDPCLRLKRHEKCQDVSNATEESHPKPIDITKLIDLIIDYDSRESSYQFTSSFHTCGVCFTEKLGTDCVKFPQCRHIYCSECVSHFFTLQIRDGAVRSLTCPDTECDTEVGPHFVKSSVDQLTYAKYEDFLLQSTLDSMVDVVYCPRNACQTAVLLDQDGENLGRCATCTFVFCVVCKLSYHGGSPCRGAEKEETKEEETKEDGGQTFDEIVEKSVFDDYSMNIFDSEAYVNGSVETRNEMERKYGKARKYIQKDSSKGGTAKTKQMQSICSEVVIDILYTPCPNCRTPFEKISGCNHVLCTKCKCEFCWGCGKRYPHVNGCC